MFGPADFAAPLKHPVLKQKIGALLAWRQETGGLVAGYAGSLRYSDGAFQALAAASQRTAPPVKVVLFGGVSPRQLQFFDKRAVVLPFVGYEAYAAALGALEPDILIAPLDRSRTSMSKCPIKYLDYSIAGAAGVYSDMPPYSQTIVDGKTGLLVRDDDAASWAAAIVRLIEDEALRRSIAPAARRDVQERYETAVVAPAFAAALRERDRRTSPGPKLRRSRSPRHVDPCAVLPLAAPLRRRADAVEPGNPAGAVQGRSSRAAGAGRRRTDRRGAAATACTTRSSPRRRGICFRRAT